MLSTARTLARAEGRQPGLQPLPGSRLLPCRSPHTRPQLDFIECNLWFIEELAAGKPSISKVHCSKDCATQWGKVRARAGAGWAYRWAAARMA